MAPNCRSPIGNHYSYVDKWKTELRENQSNEIKPGPDLANTSRPATCPMYRPDEMSREGCLTRNCCRTNNDIPYGAHFPVGDAQNSFSELRDCQRRSILYTFQSQSGEVLNSLKRKASAKSAKHLEYGYEASWRPSRAVVPVKDIMEPCVVTPAEVEFRPSIKVIDSGTGAWSEKWKASRRHIDPGHSKDFEWRPCVRTSHPHKRGHEVVYRPQVRPDPKNSTLETNEGHFKPIRRHLVPYTPLTEPAPYKKKKHIIVPAEWVPPFRIQGEDYNTAPKRQLGKARVQQYAASHLPLCLAWETPDQDGTVPSASDRPGSPSAYNHHGANPFEVGPNGLRRNTRRYIPSGHLTHFENKNCCVCKVGEGDIRRTTLRNHSASGPYHDTVPDRNPIVGHMPETDVLKQTKFSKGPALFGPAGSINSDIIDHKFSGLRQVRTPVSEMKDQYRRWDNVTQINS